VLASGGLDSAALIGWALERYRRVQPVYGRFGLRWERAELHWLRRYLAALPGKNILPLAVLEIPSQGTAPGHWSLTGKRVPGYRSPDAAVYLPGRNALLLAKAGVYAASQGIQDILIGTLRSNPFPDATPAFFRAASRALSLAMARPVRILAPFRNKTKKNVLRAAQGLPLHLAFSCLNPNGIIPCRACNKCAERDRVII
jgi:7-cyano-7-deazaguanine synthase